MVPEMATVCISEDERGDRMVELVSALGRCAPQRAAQAIEVGRRGRPVDLTADPQGFGGTDDPWSTVACALVALRR